ncbi:MAG: P pilus assembly protein, chaperone PapD [Goleter apudmare HA4340-LM2]|nr:P pilus assembly protein, chaperone PapD [Goleter apudmare HA4340-LM2]
MSFLSKTIFALALSTLFLLPSAAKAQVKVSPLVIEAKTERGQAQGLISITNLSDTPSRVRVYAEPFTYKRDTGFETLPKNSPNNLTPYLQFSPRELTIQPGQTRRIRAITRLAPNLPEGEYRAVVFNETLTERKDSTGKIVTLATRIGVTVYVAKGKVSPNLVIDSANFDPKQKKVQLLVRNTGKATTRPGVSWKISRGATVVKTGEIESASVIAESDRNISINYPGKDDQALAPGTYQLSGELLWGENNQKKLPFNLSFTVPSKPVSSGQKLQNTLRRR